MLETSILKKVKFVNDDNTPICLEITVLKKYKL